MIRLEDDDWFGEEITPPVQAGGSITQLSEQPITSLEDVDEYSERLARKKPLGFAPWPTEEEEA